MQATTKWQRWMAVAMLGGVLLLGACSDDDGDEAGAATGDDASEASDLDAPITQADGEPFLAALIAGNGDEALSTCLGEKVHAAVEGGDLTPRDVREWTNGEGVDGPLQDYISEPDVVVECSTAAATTVAS